jgi:hypothetical protein
MEYTWYLDGHEVLLDPSEVFTRLSRSDNEVFETLTQCLRDSYEPTTWVVAVLCCTHIHFFCAAGAAVRGLAGLGCRCWCCSGRACRFGEVCLQGGVQDIIFQDIVIRKFH